MNRLFRFFVERSFLVNLLTLFVVIIGAYSYSSMKRDLIPAWEWPSISISAQLPGASSAEVERFLTYPIEEALQALPGANDITSTSSNGYAQITVFYPFGSGDLTDELEQIRSRVDSVRSLLPEASKELRIAKNKNHKTFLMAANILGFDVSNPEHFLLLRKYEQGLLAIPGVVELYKEVPEEGLYIEINRRVANRLGLSIGDIKAQLQQKLQFTPVGQYRQGDTQIFIEINQSLTSLAQIQNLPLRSTRSNTEIRLKDIAEVKLRPGETESVRYFNGERAISIRASKSLDVDSVDLKAKVDAYNEKFNETLPAGMSVAVTVDGAHFIQKQLQILSSNGWIGLVLVVLLLILLLNWKTSLVVAIGVPVAYFGTLTVLHSMGIAFDLFSVVGLILVLGMLVDDAIIVSEKYNEKLELGLPPKDAATSSARELFVPVTGAILTTVVAFLPILFVQSWVSVVLYSTPVIVIAALSFSLIESFLILPNHMAHFVSKPTISRSTEVFNAVKAKYSVIIHKILRFRYLVAALGLVMIIGAGYLAMTKLKHDFNLNIDVVSVAVNVVLNESESLADSYAQLGALEKELLAMVDLPEIENLTTSIGSVWRDGRERKGYNYAKLSFLLDRHSSAPADIKEKVKALTAPIVEKYASTFAEISLDEDMTSQNEAKKDLVSMRIQGRDEVDYYQLEQEVAQTLAARKDSVLTEAVESDGYQLSWRFIPDSGALLKHGLTVGDVASQARSAFLPDEVGEVRYLGQSVKVLLDAGKEDYSFERLSRFPLINGIGEVIPSSFVGQWQESKVQRSISHKELKRSMQLDFRFNEEKGNQLQARKELEDLAKELAAKHATLEFTVDDSSKEEAEAKSWSSKIAVICIVAVLFILALTLNSLTLPLLAATPIPFGLAAIVYALYMHDLPMGIMAIIGLVGTVGVCVNASLIMVNEVNTISARSGGWSHKNIVDGSTRRLRAITISILTTLAGVAPMAYGLGGDSSFLQPLAFSIFWGLSASTLITLFFLPSFMAIHLDFERLMKWSVGKLSGRDRSVPAVDLRELQESENQRSKRNSELGI